ncbi:MAG: hypothetical protein LPK09_07610, partial [Hymenobacteraceae bacterium]|nr:hypothetical protein [Hymenobacteraceae bacterium]
HYGLGSAEETLNGAVYKPAGVCYQQGWSETMVLQPVSEGMLGFAPDALSNKVALSPRFPWHWNEVKVDNILFGDHRINLKMERTPASTRYSFDYAGGTGCGMAFSQALPLGTQIEKVLVNGKSVQFSTKNTGESLQLTLEQINLRGDVIIEISHQGGIGALPLVNEPKPGDSNQGAKIVGEELRDNKHTVTIEGLAGKSYQFNIVSNQAIRSVSNGKLVKKDGNQYTLEVLIPKGDKKYEESKVVITLESFASASKK